MRKGYITVFLTLSLTLILSLVFTVIEGARISAIRICNGVLPDTNLIRRHGQKIPDAWTAPETALRPQVFLHITAGHRSYVGLSAGRRSGEDQSWNVGD